MTKVLIVGAGVVGLCVGYELARAGLEVHLFDKGGAGVGASSNNAGWVVPIMAAPVTSPTALLRAPGWLARRTSPLGIALNLEKDHLAFLWALAKNCSRRRFEEARSALSAFALSAPDDFATYEKMGLEFERHNDGILMVFQYRRNLVHWQKDLDAVGGGRSSQVLEAEAARELQPALSGAGAGFAYCRGEARVDPVSFVRAMKQECCRLGVHLYEGSQVTAFRRRGAHVTGIIADGQDLDADVVVLSAGAWTAGLCELLGEHVPIRPGKGYGFDLSPRRAMSKVAVYLYEARVNLSPLERCLRLSGVMEFGGLDLEIDDIRARAMLEAPKSYLRDWDIGGEELTPWIGLRPMTPDGLPCIGWLGRYDNVLIAAGHGLFGVTLAPATAKAVAHCVTKGEAPEELSAFKPARFGPA